MSGAKPKKGKKGKKGKKSGRQSISIFKQMINNSSNQRQEQDKKLKL